MAYKIQTWERSVASISTVTNSRMNLPTSLFGNGVNKELKWVWERPTHTQAQSQFLHQGIRNQQLLTVTRLMTNTEIVSYVEKKPRKIQLKELKRCQGQKRQQKQRQMKSGIIHVCTHSRSPCCNRGSFSNCTKTPASCFLYTQARTSSSSW